MINSIVNIFKPTPIKVILSLVVTLLIVLFLPVFPLRCLQATIHVCTALNRIPRYQSAILYNSLGSYFLDITANALPLSQIDLTIDVIVKLLIAGVFLPYLLVCIFVESLIHQKQDIAASLWKRNLLIILKPTIFKFVAASLIALVPLRIFITVNPIIIIGCQPGFGGLCDSLIVLSFNEYIGRLLNQYPPFTPDFHVITEPIIILLITLILIPYPIAGLVETALFLKQNKNHKKRV